MEQGGAIHEGLQAFAEQFAAQLRAAGSITHEHTVHFCLALGLNSALELKPGEILFEKPHGTKRIDLWVVPTDLAIEVKYQRPNPSDWNRAFTQLYGSLLADFNKIAQVQASNRLVVFVADSLGLNHLRRSGRGLLPLETAIVKQISSREVDQLPATVAAKAAAHGAWTPLRTSLVWQAQRESWQLLAWSIEPDAIADAL